jgi:hypothetical protein
MQLPLGYGHALLIVALPVGRLLGHAVRVYRHRHVECLPSQAGNDDMATLIAMSGPKFEFVSYYIFAGVFGVFQRLCFQNSWQADSARFGICRILHTFSVYVGLCKYLR